MVTPRDLAVATWVTRKSLLSSVGETVSVLNLCLDQIYMNSVLYLERVCLVLANSEHFVSLRLNLSKYCEYCYSRM